MKIVETTHDMINQSEHLKSQSSVGFVPTMGGIHKGHLSLVAASKKQNQYTVVSLFLNPTQFNSKDDFETYPSSLNEDLRILEKAGVDIVFCPKTEDIYSEGYLYKVTESEFSKRFCGKHRPGHFDGVLTIVLKLFNIVKPQRAYFGEKDFQQLELVKGMVTNFFLPIEIIGVPIYREATGLALSTRNKKLNIEALNKAPKFFQILSSNKENTVKENELKDAGFDVDYIESWKGRTLGAVWIDGVRLIDNV